MTIALGSKYPWDSFKKILPQGAFMRESVILMSDSRICTMVRERYSILSDTGAKLFVLNENTAAVYAGICRIAEQCIEELRSELIKSNNRLVGSVWEMVSLLFEKVYASSIMLPRDNFPLYIVIGTCNRQGTSHLYHFSYHNKFIPEEISGLRVIAWPNTKTEFEGRLSSEVEKRVGNASWFRQSRLLNPPVPAGSWLPVFAFKAEEAAIIMSAILNNVIHIGRDPTIGGMVQCAVIDSEGISFPSIVRFENILTAESTNITARPEDLKTTTPISGVLGSYTIIK